MDELFRVYVVRSRSFTSLEGGQGKFKFRLGKRYMRVFCRVVRLEGLTRFFLYYLLEGYIDVGRFAIVNFRNVSCFNLVL